MALAGAFTIVCIAGWVPVLAQDYPVKPIRLLF